jgi:hypothetical protein
VRDLTWLSGVPGSGRAAAHARFVIAHQAGRELREHAHPGKLPGDAHAEPAYRQTLALVFPQQLLEATSR